MTWLQTEDAAVRGGDPDRAAAVGADRDGDKASGNGVCAAAGAAACVVGVVVGVARCAPVRVVVGRVEADFVHVGFADDEGAGIDEALDAPGGGAGVGGDSAAAGGFGEGHAESFGRAGDGELVFDEDGDAGEGGAGREGDG